MLTNAIQTCMYRYPLPMLNYCTRAWAWMGALIKWKRNGHNSSLFFYRKSWSGSISVFSNFCNKYALSGVWGYSYTFRMLSFIYCMYLILHCKLIQTFDSCIFLFSFSLFSLLATVIIIIIICRTCCIMRDITIVRNVCGQC